MFDDNRMRNSLYRSKSRLPQDTELVNFLFDDFISPLLSFHIKNVFQSIALPLQVLLLPLILLQKWNARVFWFSWFSVCLRLRMKPSITFHYQWIERIQYLFLPFFRVAIVCFIPFPKLFVDTVVSRLDIVFVCRGDEGSEISCVPLCRYMRTFFFPVNSIRSLYQHFDFEKIFKSTTL